MRRINVICIKNNNQSYPLFVTKGKIYRVDDFTTSDDDPYKDYYWFTNDLGNYKQYHKSLFMTEKELRKQKLEKLKNI
jgi:hypothetical protein